VWEARHRPNGRFVGRGGLRRVQVGGRDEVEVAYALVPAFNAASRRGMEKARFRHERDIEHAGLPHVLHRLRRQDWAGGQGTWAADGST
jgi:RimJ/RimL family protein N-acetyltransferase